MQDLIRHPTELIEMLLAADVIKFPDGSFIRHFPRLGAWCAYISGHAIINPGTLTVREFSSPLEAYHAIKHHAEKAAD